jgi:hypothetical protein
MPRSSKEMRSRCRTAGWGGKGYLETVSWCTQHSADADGAASVVWLSPLVPLVDSEPTTALQRLAMVVDSANGAGAASMTARIAGRALTVTSSRLPWRPASSSPIPMIRAARGSTTDLPTP